MPDTGCTQTIIKTTAAQKRGIRFQSGDPTILLTASGQRMRVDGAGRISVEANGISADINALVSDAIQDEMLLSYTDLIALKIIPGGFPNTVIESCPEITTSSECEKLIMEYPDVLSDELSPRPMKTDKPMHIHLKEGAVPRKVTSARRVTLRYEKQAEKTVNELVKKGVIVPANETTDWCVRRSSFPRVTKSECD